MSLLIKNFDWQGRKVLITGANGFKGAWLSAVLVQLGADVHGVANSRSHPDSAYELLGLSSVIEEVHTDITDRQRVFDLINTIRPDVILHLAAKALVPVCLRDPGRAFEVNFSGTINIIDACRTLRICKQLLICSTDHVFGPVPESAIPLHEDTPIGFGGPYDTSKAAMELAVRSFYDTYSDELPLMCITRAANCFAAGDMNQRRVIPSFIQNGLMTGEVPLTTRLNGRQFVSVADAVCGYILAVSMLGEIGLQKPSGRPKLPTFHFSLEKYVGTSESFLRVKDLARTIAEMINARVVELPECVDYVPHENPVQGPE